MAFSADFETTTNPNFLRVWAWALCDINNTNTFYYGTKIDEFFSVVKKLEIKKLYFHNLKFDGEFILLYLFNNGWKHSYEKKLHEKEFTTLISDRGQWYTIEINMGEYHLRIYDSLKILNMPVKAIPKAFGIDGDCKGEIDYNEYRAEWHKLTSLEIEYIREDVVIVAKALAIIFSEGHTKITQGSNAMQDYQTIIGKKKFRSYFPVPAYDSDIRTSYRGGWCYLNPCYKNVIVENGWSLDVNSLYPSRMYYEQLPYGAPVWYQGKYPGIPSHPLFIQKFSCEFDLKPGKLPTLQLKYSSQYQPTEYVKSSKGYIQTLSLCSCDMDLFFDHYYTYNIKWLDGWAFRSTDTLFREYIDKWIAKKIEAKKTGNKSMYTWSKVMLNSLYGKFALNPKAAKKEPKMVDGALKFNILEPEDREPIYLPVGTFITAYARKYTITWAQKVRDYSLEKYGKDMFIYSDTDSIKTILPENDIRKLFDIDPVALGKWDLEAHFDIGKFLRAKTYVTIEKGEKHVTCCGMPSNIYPDVTLENFKIGAKYQGKIMPRHYKGGIVLESTTFEIKV